MRGTRKAVSLLLLVHDRDITIAFNVPRKTGPPRPASAFCRQDLRRKEIPIARLLQDGKEIAFAFLDGKSREVRFPNFAPEEYQLHVLGPEDFRERMHGHTLQTASGQPATIGWKTKEIPVKVTADSPAILDAGEIELEKVQLPAR